jgi:Immunity protein family (Imm11)
MTDLAIFTFEADSDHYAGLTCSDDSMARLTRIRFDGTALLPGWSPLHVRAVPPGAPRSNFPAFPEMAVDGRAVEALRDVFGRAGELLPLESPDGEFYIFNVLAMVDCLDESASKGRRFPSGRFMWIHEHVFSAERVGDAEIFKIPQLALGPHVYLTSRFVELVERSGLTGFAPVEVWSESAGPRYFGVTTP